MKFVTYCFFRSLWIVPHYFPYSQALLCYLIISPVPTYLVHNCETSWGLLYFHLLSPLSRDQIPFDPHQCLRRFCWSNIPLS